ncbi:MAG: hypothetical protein CMC14_11440 [Flavobacteriaceae bacterium]|nr:hypothetical protein [Flavobacteriaceae bacterium]
MPVVFSPGEPETRPLDPTATVYTTAQKVADLLDIGPSEAVLVSADSVSDGVFITGGDYRNDGYAVGDTILIYSDADPLGVEKTITAITSSASGVKLAFTGGFTHADYQVADNAYVQNQASFTNGRTRGLTKSKVDKVIMKMQDKIDNITHNAWRPYLVSAEYVNFDTYKPYRRRYYTDYVGTAPLLFRNVQQVLRLELWQGADYREIGAAEARIKLPDDVRSLDNKTIVLSPGNGTAVTLQAIKDSNSTGAWEVSFDKVSSAQNLADLINKEDRVNKAELNFSPAFYLEDGDGTSKVSVHNEFLASANADYGTGTVKVTSMRPTKAGEICSIVTNSSDITISQTTRNTATVASGGGSTVTVDTTDGFAKAGVFTDGTNIIRYTDTNATQFTGCATVVGSLPSSGTITQDLFQVDLQGGSSSGDQARLRDWWLDHEMGIIYFNNSYPFFEWNAIKVAYIYGERYLEKAIEDVCTKMVAIELLMADDRSVLIPEGTQNIDVASKVQLYQADIDRTLPKYIEMVVFE